MHTDTTFTQAIHRWHMHGWRGRLGLIVPSSNTTNEPEFYRCLPEGISLHTSRMYLEDTNENQLEKMATDSERCCELLLTADVDVIAYGCTTGSFVKGPEFDKEIESRITKITGVPTVATAAAIKRAFDALQLEKIAIATPYVNRLNKRETEFLQSAGYSVVDMSGLGIEPNTEIGAQKPEHVYRQAMKLDTTDADGVFISCTNYRTFEVIDQLEEDLGLPVVTSNQATLWNSLRAMGVKSSDLILGRLFEEQAL